MPPDNGFHVLGPECDQGGWASRSPDRYADRVLVANYDCDACEVQGRAPVTGEPVRCWNCSRPMRPTSQNYVRPWLEEAG